MAKAHAALSALVASPDQAVRLLGERLGAAEPLDPERIRRFVTDLDSSEFAVRDAASRELERSTDEAALLNLCCVRRWR